MQPKVIAITKKKSLSKISLAAVFGEESDEDNMQDMNLLVKKFSKFLRRNKGTDDGSNKRFIKSN
ncbi:hypothetical protein Lal_00041787 [Lupinus albus]|nr:hypothetical protein Lal_00041787 [Lupinus albus]